MAEYSGTIELVSGIRTVPNGEYALVNAPDIQVDNTGKKLNIKLTEIDSTKADKVSSATNNNFAALDANGNLKDSGHKHSDYLTSYDPILLKHSIDIDANTSSNYVWGNAIFPEFYPAKDLGHCYVADYYISNPKAFASDITVKYLSDTLSIDFTLNPNSSATTITFTLCKQADATTTMKLHTGYQYAEKVASTSKAQSIIDIYGR